MITFKIKSFSKEEKEENRKKALKTAGTAIGITALGSRLGRLGGEGVEELKKKVIDKTYQGKIDAENRVAKEWAGGGGRWNAIKANLKHLRRGEVLNGDRYATAAENIRELNNDKTREVVALGKKNLGKKGALIGAGIGLSAYGAKKLYDYRKKKKDGNAK